MKTATRAIFILGCVFGSEAKAYDLNLDSLYNGDFLKVDQMYLEFRKYEDYRNAYLPDAKGWQFRGEFHNNLSAFSVLFWNTNLHLSMDRSQIRYVGLEYYLGLHLTPWADAIKYHHSEHVLEQEVPGNKKFPVEDSYGFRIYFKR